MEIRANYIIVGLFSIFALLGGLGFTLWTVSLDKGVALTMYDIHVMESVKGLSVNNNVLFTGIRVGKVTEIQISNVIPGQVKVRIAIAASTPVREDSVAQLEMQGLTGNVVISITGGTAASPLLRASESEVAAIRYQPSSLASVVAQMPEILRRMDLLFSENNTLAFTEIIQSVAKLSRVFANRAESLDAMLANAEKAARNLALVTDTANTVLSAEAKKLSVNMNEVVKRAETSFALMEPGIKQFTGAMADLRILMAEVRRLVHLLTNLGQTMESDPRRFLFGEPVKEYEVP